MIEVNGKLLTEEEFEALKKDPSKKLVEDKDDSKKFKLLERMHG